MTSTTKTPSPAPAVVFENVHDYNPLLFRLCWTRPLTLLKTCVVMRCMDTLKYDTRRSKAFFQVASPKSDCHIQIVSRLISDSLKSNLEVVLNATSRNESLQRVKQRQCQIQSDEVLGFQQPVHSLIFTIK